MSVILLGIFDSAIAVTKETTGLTKSIRMGLYFKNKMTLKSLFPLIHNISYCAICLINI